MALATFNVIPLKSFSHFLILLPNFFFIIIFKKTLRMPKMLQQLLIELNGLIHRTASMEYQVIWLPLPIARKMNVS